MVRRAEMGGEGVWAAGGLIMSQLLPLHRTPPWEGGGTEDPAEERARQLASRASLWTQAPGMAAALRVPRPSREEMTALWQDWPSLCAGLQLPQAEQWVERAEEP